jgi:hypothetical protein
LQARITQPPVPQLSPNDTILDDIDDEILAGMI